MVWEAERSNLYKKVYFETLNKYHKNCLTIFYEDCLNENYWKNTLNKKLENFMQDKMQNVEYETENKKLKNVFNVINLDGNNWDDENYHRAKSICQESDLSANADSLTKILKFEG